MFYSVYFMHDAQFVYNSKMLSPKTEQVSLLF